MSSRLLFQEKDLYSAITVFKNICIVEGWNGTRVDCRVTVVMLIPNVSSESSEEHDLKVSDDEMALELTVLRPHFMNELLQLDKSEIQIDSNNFMHYPSLLSFRPYL